MKNCNCTLGLTNSGIPNCQPVMKVARKLIVVPMFQDDGTANEIDLTSDTLDSAFFLGKRDNVDSSQRWYPLPKMENVETSRDNPIKEDFNSGRSITIQDGVRTFTGLLVQQYGTFLNKIEDYGCDRVGVFIVDKDGNLIGISDTANKLRPIEIDGDSWKPILQWGDDTTSTKIQLNFNWDMDEQDRNIRMIKKSDLDNYNLLSLNGLLDVYGRDLALPTSTTQLKVALFYEFGGLKDQGDYTAGVEGLGVDDIVVYNVTTDTDVTPSAVTETPEGTYELTFAAQTSADVLKVKVDKSGFSAEYVEDTAGADIEFTVP